MTVNDLSAQVLGGLASKQKITADKVGNPLVWLAVLSLIVNIARLIAQCNQTDRPVRMRRPRLRDIIRVGIICRRAFREHAPEYIGMADDLADELKASVANETDEALESLVSDALSY